MKRVIFLAVLAVMALSLAHLLAQDKKNKKEKTAPVNQATTGTDADDATDVTRASGDSAAPTRYFLYPEFYTYWPVDNNDTILKYECYDISHNPIITDTLINANDIQYITLIKTYSDYLKTYIDPEGKPRPQPVSKTLYMYERTGTNTWKSFDVVNNFSVTLQEHKERIVRKDTTYTVNPVSGSKQLTIREYYKVTEVEGSEVLNANKMPDGGAQSGVTYSDKNSTDIFYFSVPEFYFHWPKKDRDTIYEFLCYDDRDSLIPFVENYDSVHYYSLFKKFIDSTHTYKDDDGKRKPLPVANISKRYDKTGKDKWISVEYPENRFTELKAFPDAVVSIDTEAVIDPVTDHTLMKIYKHYRVIKN